MPTAGKFCILSTPSEHHCFSSFYMIVLEANPTPPLHMFRSPSRSPSVNLERTVIRPVKEVAPRSSIRGFKDDYYHVGTDVVLVEGEIHMMTNTVSIFALSHAYMSKLTLFSSHPSAKRGACASQKIEHALDTQV